MQLEVGVGNTLLSKTEVYNPVTNRWTDEKGGYAYPARRDCPQVRWIIKFMPSVEGRGTSVGCSLSSKSYDPVTNIWTRKTDMPTPRWGSIN